MRTLLLSVLLGAVTFAASGVNYSGRWAMQSAGRGGQSILALNQVGKEVTGTIGARVDAGAGTPVGTEILAGTVEGDTISFYVWGGRDQPVKTYYKGTMSGEDTITFTVTSSQAAQASGGPGRGADQAGGGGRGGPQQVTAKRAK
jgi:hypothetical protein